MELKRITKRIDCFAVLIKTVFLASIVNFNLLSAQPESDNINLPDLESINNFSDELQTFYNFSENFGKTIFDRSNVGIPLNLTISNTKSVTWKSPGLIIKSPVKIKSSISASKIITSSKASNELTFEAWFISDNNTQNSGIAKLMSITDNNVNSANLEFWQLDTIYGINCRTSTSPLSGYSWNTSRPKTKLIHFVFTHSHDGIIKLFINNNLIIKDTVTGDFSTWDDTFQLFLGCDYSTNSYWSGTFYKLAIYSNALSENDVYHLYCSGLLKYDFTNIQINDITNTNLIGDAFNSGYYGGHGIMFGDVDNDGDPDLYITMNNDVPMADQFFENINGIFTEKGKERGIENYDSKGSHGWLWVDLDNDGDLDGWNGSYTQNIPYSNRNDKPGYFTNMFSTSGIANIKLGTRGLAAFDFDNDGDLDLFGNNWYARETREKNEFYRNDGDFHFTRIDNGLTNSKGDQGVCDGDFDNDGDMDLILSVLREI